MVWLCIFAFYFWAIEKLRDKLRDQFKVTDQGGAMANNGLSKTEKKVAFSLASVFGLRMMGLFMIIILGALGFGIVNTMLMVVLERTKELGMLMAIGMNKRKVFFMIMLETLFLALVGAVFGDAWCSHAWQNRRQRSFW